MIVRAIIVSLAFAVIPLASAGAQSAPSTIVIEPSSLELEANTDFTVAVSARTGEESVNAVEFVIEYSADTLRFNAFDSSSSDFEIEAPGSAGESGVIKMARASIDPKNSERALITVLSFTPTADGPATVRVSTDSKLLSAENSQNILSSTFEYAATVGGPIDSTPGEVSSAIGGVSETTLEGQPVASLGGQEASEESQAESLRSQSDGSDVSQQQGSDSPASAGSGESGITSEDTDGSKQWIVAAVAGFGAVLVLVGYGYVRHTSKKNGLQPEPILQHGGGIISSVRPDTLPRSNNPEHDDVDDLLNQVHGAEVKSAEVVTKKIDVG